MNKIGTRHNIITMYNFIEQHLNTEIKSQQPIQIRQHCSHVQKQLTLNEGVNCSSINAFIFE